MADEFKVKNGLKFPDNTVQTTAAVAASGGLDHVFTSTSLTVDVNTFLLADTTSSSITVTLPASPTNGDVVAIVDAQNKFSINAVTVARNGNTIQGEAGNITLDISGQTLYLVYDGTTWLAYAHSFTPFKNPLLMNLTGPASGNEGDDILITIDDYNASYTYDFSVTGGSASRAFEVITWHLPAVTSDTNYTLNASRFLNGVTQYASLTITVINVATTADGFVSITDFGDGDVFYTGWSY